MQTLGLNNPVPHDRALAHKHSVFNRTEIESSTICGCFYCFSTFLPSEIIEWVDHGQTALCPHCPVDSVLGSSSGFPITRNSYSRCTSGGSEMSQLRILIAGGGTGGHVIPALAIGRELRDTYGAGVTFVGTARGMETRLVPEAGFPLELIHVGQLKNVSLATRAKTLTELPRGVALCVRLLRRLKPQVVVGVGGYASGPAMLAAVLLRLPTVAFEPNAAPGLANRLVGRFVSAAAVNFPETSHFFRRAQVTGIPVRPEFFNIAPKPQETPRRLLLLGGSQGAQALNQVMPQAAAMVLTAVPGLTIVHQAGERHAATTQAAYDIAGVDPARVHVTAFLNAAEAIAAADLVLCRSGASTVAELCAAGRPAVFVPFPQAADDHQTRNAEELVRLGAAALLPQRELTPARLAETLARLLEDTEALASMAEHAHQAARPDALRTIAALVSSFAR